MDPLIYCAQHLGYILGVKPLAFEKQVKVDLIKDVNTIQLALGKGPLTPKQFYDFYDGPLETLTQIVRDQSSLLFPPLHHNT